MRICLAGTGAMGVIHMKALKKIEAASKVVPLDANPATAHLFIIQPLLGINAGMFANLFSTHPPIAKRIERLTGRPAEFMQ